MKFAKLLLGGAIVLGAASAALAEDQRLHIILCGDENWGGDINAKYMGEWEAANPGYKADVEYVPWGQCQEKATTLAAGGTPPAIAYMGSRTLKQLAQNDMILSHDLTDAEKATYAAPILGTVMADGKIWGLPRAFSTKALYWNKDLFKAAGLLPNSAPTTWDDMLMAAAAIKDKTDADGIGLVAAEFDNTMHQFLNYLYTNGGEVINADGEIVLDSPNNIETLEFYAKTLPTVSQPGPTAHNRDDLRPMFVQQSIGMWISGPWERGNVGDAVNWGVAPLPVGPNGTPSTLLITDSYAVFKNSGVEEAALSLAKFMTSPDQQMDFDISAGLTPLRPNHPRVQELRDQDATWGAFLDAIPTGGPEPLLTDYSGTQDVFSNMIQAVLLDDVDPADAIAEAAEELEDLK